MVSGCEMGKATRNSMVLSLIAGMAALVMMCGQTAVLASGPPLPPTRDPGPTPANGTQSDALAPRPPGSGNVNAPGPVAVRPPGAAIAAPSAPQSNRSYYVMSLPTISGPQDSGGRAYGFGRTQGQIDAIRTADAGYPVDSAIILAFGKPHVAQFPELGVTCSETTKYHTLLVSGLPGCRDKIKLYVENWIEGYIAGLQGEQGPTLTLIIGVNNTDNSRINDPDPNAPGQYNHVAAGQDWGDLVNELTTYARGRGYSKATVFGGDDIETGPSVGANIGYEPPNLTKLWLQGYHNNSGFVMFDFGDSGGCPANNHTGTVLCNGAWYQSDVWFVSMQGNNYPIPEIYARPSSLNNNPDPNISINASVWEQLALYDYNLRGGTNYAPVYFIGSLTQYSQCQVVSCNGTDNRATDGWNYLFSALSDTHGAFLPNNPQQVAQMAQIPTFAFDIASDTNPTVPS